MRRCLTAHTPCTSPYPPYLNVSEEEAIVTITVRSPGTRLASGVTLCGETSAIALPRDVAIAHLREALEQLESDGEGRG